MDKIYRQGQPNAFLASFAPFIKQNINHPFLTQIVYEAFNQFFNNYIREIDSYTNFPIGFIGSISHYFKEILVKVANEWGLQIEQIQKDPIDGLYRYHQLRHLMN